MPRQDLTLVALIWNPAEKTVDEITGTRDDQYEMTRRVEAAVAIKHTVIQRFCYVTKTGEFAGSW